MCINIFVSETRQVEEDLIEELLITPSRSRFEFGGINNIYK